MFRFRQFSIDQSGCGMKISTDGILFGSWIDAKSAGSVLDVGTGTGILSMMLAQRFENLAIDAIEIDAVAASRASENFQNCPWADRLKLVEGDFCSLKIEKKLDLVVCNPPFYKTTHNYSSKERKMARNDETLNASDLIARAAALTTKSGRLAVIIPCELEETFAQMNTSFKHVSRRYEVRPVEGADSKRILLELSKVESEIDRGIITVCNRDQSYTEQFKAMTKAFYLK